MCFNLEKASPFVRMIVFAVTGIVLGIVLGLLFALLIDWVSTLIVPMPVSWDGKGGMPDSYARSPAVPYEIASFLGMGAGAIIGAILGAINANKK